MEKQEEVTTFYSLGLEELAMALGVINCGDLGHSLLTTVYDKLTEEKIEERLTSASHSLMARGLVGITNNSTPVLEKTFEQALFPLAHFDHLIHLSLVQKKEQLTSTIHIRKNISFSSHSVDAGVIHLLEYGNYSDLPSFLGNLFMDSQKNNDGIKLDVDNSITPLILSRATKETKQKNIEEIFLSNNWNQKQAKNLAEDISKQIMRGTIVYGKVSGDAQLENLEDIPRQMLWILKGKKRNWVFQFPSTDDNALGSVLQIDKNSFTEIISNFLA
jgi:hypothetical protein